MAGGCLRVDRRAAFHDGAAKSRRPRDNEPPPGTWGRAWCRHRRPGGQRPPARCARGRVFLFGAVAPGRTGSAQW